MTNKLQVRDANPSQRQYNNEYYQPTYPYQQIPMPIMPINNTPSESVQEPSSESVPPVFSLCVNSNIIEHFSLLFFLPSFSTEYCIYSDDLPYGKSFRSCRGLSSDDSYDCSCLHVLLSYLPTPR